MPTSTPSLALFLSCLLALSALALGHGYLADPPARNALGKLGCGDVPTNYDLMGLAAGGPSVVSQIGHGLCGDRADGVQEHYKGGKYATGTIAGHYAPGSSITVTVVITAHHLGHFEFRLCDLDSTDPMDDADQGCLDANVLVLSGTEGDTQWELPAPSANMVYEIDLDLPSGVTCNRCVLQWYYLTGNSPGAYPEEFWNCADISITDDPADADLVCQTEFNGEKPPTNDDGQCLSCSNGQKCVAKAGQDEVDDAFCDSVKCYDDWLEVCEWVEDDTTPQGGDCVSIVAHISDDWCVSVNCDPVYADFCERTASTDGGDGGDGGDGDDGDDGDDGAAASVVPSWMLL
ncbi:Chitin-binding type-4 domain-containing protein [Balamuthia mandrillaris]